MMNCLYDCRYCFLQGMYRSAHYVLFVNYEDFSTAIADQVQKTPGEDVYFFSGYDCDSLVFDPVTKFVNFFLPLFRSLPNAWIELRTKSTQIRALLAMDPIDNAIIAFSFSPDEIAKNLEHKTPSVQKRLDAIVKLQQKGWKIGLRFDPLIYHHHYAASYSQLFADVFNVVSLEQLHSVSLGGFRMPDSFFQNIVKLYPEEKLFAGPLEKSGGMVSYRKDLEQKMFATCENCLLDYIPKNIFFPCTDTNEVV